MITIESKLLKYSLSRKGLREFVSAALLTSGLILSALGCGDGASGAASGAPGAGSAKPAASSHPSAKSGASAPAKTAEPAKAVVMVDTDLEPGDAKWKGWTAKGPEGAQVLADGSHGTRIAGKGESMLTSKPGDDTGYDIAFGWGKRDMKELKANLEKGAAASEGKSVLTFTKDEADMLEWKSQFGDRTYYNFVMNMEVEKTAVHCNNNYMVGAGNEEQHKRHMEGCKSLAKKK